MNNLIGPVISEKSMNEAARGRYTFKVSNKATKEGIKKEVEKRFKVNVLKVSTIRIKGRSVKVGQRMLEFSQSPFKKAVVLVKEGQKISIFDAGAKE